MLKKITLFTLLTTSCLSAFSFEERIEKMKKFKDPIAFFVPDAPPMETEYQEMVAKVSAIMGGEKEKWINHGRPSTGKQDFIFFFFPEKEDALCASQKWRKQVLFQDFYNDDTFTFDELWKHIQKTTTIFPNMTPKKEILSQDDTSMVYQIYGSNERWSFHRIGIATKFEGNRYWNFEYQEDMRVLPLEEQDAILQKLKLIQWKFLYE